MEWKHQTSHWWSWWPCWWQRWCPCAHHWWALEHNQLRWNFSYFWKFRDNTKFAYIPENDLVVACGIELLQDRENLLKLELLSCNVMNVILNSLKIKCSKLVKKSVSIPGQWQYSLSFPSEGSWRPQAPSLSFPLEDWRHINTFQTNLTSNLVSKPLDRAHPLPCLRSHWGGCCQLGWAWTLCLL